METSHHRTLSIITFNTFGVPFDGNNIVKSLLRTKIRKRFKVIGDELNNSGADIIALQEVYTLPHLAILQKEMTKYPYSYYKKFLIGPRGGVVTFSKFPMDTVDYTDFKNKGQWLNKSFVGKLSKRGLLITKVHNMPIYIINTHLTQNSDHDWSRSNRYIPILKSQLSEIGRTLELLKNAPVILVGDFNMPKNSDLYQLFVASTGLLDVFKSDTTPTCRNIHPLQTGDVGRIDYIFTNQNTIHIQKSENILTDKFAITPKVTKFLSDHIALKADLTITLQSTPDKN
jgi:sphingomyelin phosphodiesterase 2